MEKTSASPLRVLIVAQDEPLYLHEFFETFLERIARDKGREEPRVDPVGAVILDTLGGSHIELGKKLMGVYGAVDFARLGLRYASAQVKRRLHEHNLVQSPQSISQHLDEHAIEIWPQRKINRPAVVERIEREQIDVIVGVSPPEVFQEDVLASPRLGCINSHSGPLPRYRGLMPVFWSLLNNEPELTVTIHRMNENIDDGELLLQRKVPVTPNTSLDEGIRRTKRLSGEMMFDVLCEMHAGTLEPVEVPDGAESSYFSFPTANEGKKFRQSSRSFF